MNILKDHDVVRLISQSPGRFVPFVGAGVSAESGVKMAPAICEDIRRRLIAGLSEAEAEQVVNNRLDWSNPATRYSKCIEGYGSLSHRIQYFRNELAGKSPSFPHYALAILADKDVLRKTIITTNFDKLIESAFVRLGTLECQPIRNDAEQAYIDLEPDKNYVLKLHGDYDTYNIQNTTEELLYIPSLVRERVLKIVHAAGLVVLGASGFENSIQGLFTQLREAMNKDTQTLAYGLLWGVYMGTDRPSSISDTEVEAAARASLSPGIVSVIEIAGKSNNLCGFFPVWGAGEFLHQVIEASCSREVAAKAELHLSHPMRLSRVLQKAGLTKEGSERHLRALADASNKLLNVGAVPPAAELVCSLRHPTGVMELELYYGNIASPTLLSSCIGTSSAVVSPDDTMISAGGGVAFALLQAAGPEYMLNELAKHQPLDQGDAAVTSAGELSVHYVVHAAALRVLENGDHIVSPENVEATVRAVMKKISALEVEVLWLPLIAAGGAGKISPRQSLAAIAKALCDSVHYRCSVRIVVYSDSVLDRNLAMRLLCRSIGVRRV